MFAPALLFAAAVSASPALVARNMSLAPGAVSTHITTTGTPVIDYLSDMYPSAYTTGTVSGVDDMGPATVTGATTPAATGTVKATSTDTNATGSGASSTQSGATATTPTSAGSTTAVSVLGVVVLAACAALL